MKRELRTRLSLVAVLFTSVTMVLSCEDSPASPSLSVSPADISSGDNPLSACFSAEPERFIITARQSITLDAGCTQSVSADAFFAWDLGDGRGDFGRVVEATYEQAGDFDIRLTVTDGGGSSSTTHKLRVNPRPHACFTMERPFATGTEPCTVRVDASCSVGSIEEYEWLFEGGPAPPLSLPDVTVTTEGPVYEYSWAEDEFCHSFRPFERTIRLTVHDESGVTDEDEDVVVFSSPAVKR